MVGNEKPQGCEKDLDEVVQIENVFLNVSKGQVASNEDLKKAFGTADVQECLLEILKKGELQVGEKERSHELSNLWLEIATIVAQKCVEPSSQKPYTVGMIEKAMKDAHFSVKPTKSAKSQALDVIKLLQTKSIIPLERAQMRVSVTMPAKEGKRLKDKIVPLFTKVEEEDWSDLWEIVGTIDPGSLRQINSVVETEVKGDGGVETLAFNALGENDEEGDDW
ncbi:ribosome biogenesis protein [Malassezia pachydermatis]